MRGLWRDPWCIGGDFNIIRFHHERSSFGRPNQSMRRFFEVIDDLELVDLPLLGGKFTWSGGLQHQIQARLDRFLIIQDCLDHFGFVSQLKIPRPTFDHTPILLERGGVRRGLTPFRFENMWLKVEGFQDLLEGWWKGVMVYGKANFVLSRKLEEIKLLIKVWNRDCFERLEFNKKLALSNIESWDRVNEERGLMMEESEARKEAKEAFKKWVLLE